MNNLEPNSIVLQQRRSASEIQFHNLVNTQFGGWSGAMENTVRATRNRVNRRANRVIPGRMPSRTFVVGEARKKAIREGVVGSESLLKRLNNRGKVTMNYDSPEKEAEQVIFSAEQALFH